MEDLFVLNEICRLCLVSKTKERSLLLFEITEQKQNRFEELTQTNLQLGADYPSKICATCSDELEKFFFYKTQLIDKQAQLSSILSEAFDFESTIDIDVDDTIEDDIYIEEHLEFDDNFTVMTIEESREESGYQNVEAIALPSYKNLQDTTDSNEIIKLIDDLEETNQIILECSELHSKAKRQKITKAPAKSVAKHKTIHSPVDRNEELIFIKPDPKLILKPTLDEDVNLVLYSKENCCSCGQDFSSEFLLKRHQRSCESSKDSNSCCDQVFESPAEFKKHRADFHPSTVACPDCGKVLKSKKTFLVHQRTHRSVLERKFKCKFAECKKAFNFKLHLENHERTHSGERPFKCNQCEASFKQSYQLTLHTRKHEGIIIKCSACDLKFHLKSQLEKHEKICTGSDNSRRRGSKVKPLKSFEL